LGIEPQGDSRSAALIQQYYPMNINNPKYVGGYFLVGISNRIWFQY